MVLKSFYLISCIPYYVLTDQVPHSIFFPHTTVYSSSHHIFHYTTFLHNITLGKDKFTPKAFKYLFLEYSFLQGRYCLTPMNIFAYQF